MSKIRSVLVPSPSLPFYPSPVGQSAPLPEGASVPVPQESPSGSASDHVPPSDFERHREEYTHGASHRGAVEEEFFTPSYTLMEDTSNLDESLFDTPEPAKYSMGGFSLPTVTTSLSLNEWVVFPPREDVCMTQNMLVEFKPKYVKQGPSVTACRFVAPQSWSKYEHRVQPVFIVPYYSFSHPSVRFYTVPVLPGRPSWEDRLSTFKKFLSDLTLKTKIVRHTQGATNWVYESEDTSAFDWSVSFKPLLLQAAKRQGLVVQ